jgi:Fe-S cluster biogenesis protein NfuA
MTPPDAPGLFVALFDLSNRMAATLQATEFIQQILEGLAGAGETGIAFEIACIGVRQSEIVSLLPGVPARSTIPLERLSERTLLAIDTSGEPAPAEGLAFAYRLVARWLAGKSNARTPVIVHCTSGEGFDDTYFRHLRSLSALSSTHGPPRIWHARFAPVDAPEPEAYSPAANYGGSLNTYPIEEVWGLLFDPAPGRESLPDTHSSPAFELLREFKIQKLGNEPQHWEDGYALNATCGVAVVADGASEGIFCRVWADILCRTFLDVQPQSLDQLAEFTTQCRAEWKRAIDYHNLKWSAQNKVDATGAAATLCGLTLGPAAANGSRPWRCLAVGDAVLFRVRNGKPWLSFPIVTRGQLDSAPDLLRTLPRNGAIPAILAEGRCLPGDLFLLATDAMAGHLLTLTEALDRYATMTDQDWLAEIDELRTESKMVNDDCTLLVLRVPAKLEVEPMPLLADPRTRVQQVLRDAAPSLGLDGSEIEVLEVENGIASVRLGAVCGSCPNTMSAIVASLESELRVHLPEVEMIEAVL